MKFVNIFSFFSPKILGKFDSEINGKIKVVESRGNKIIYVRGAEQSGGTIPGMWQKALNKLPKTKDKRLNALLLGLGGGDVIRFIRKIYPEIKITAVDIDPVMIKIAHDFYKIKNSETLEIVKNDALFYLLINKKKFDLIIVDLFIGFKNPDKFRTMNFLLKMKKSLSLQGIIVYNSHYSVENYREFHNFLKVCASVFKRHEIIVSYPFSRILQLSRH